MSPLVAWGRIPRVTRLWIMLTLVVLLLVLPAFLHLFLDPTSAYEIRISRALESPSSTEWFGTDALGRSLWSRTVLGFALSVGIICKALAVAMPLSLILGLCAGFWAGRWPDHLISWVIAVIYTTPFFLLVVALAAVIGSGLTVLPWIIGGIIWAAPARVVRSETRRLVTGSFVRYERALGFSPIIILTRSLLPMITAPAAISLLYLVPEIIGIDAVLSLFGLGAQPPQATLGALIYDGLRRWDAAPWLSGLPTLLLVCYALGIYSLTSGLSSQLGRPRRFRA